MRHSVPSTAREVAAVLSTGAVYWLTIYPRARHELRRWERRAREIQDPTLRAHALFKLKGEHLNPEAAAFFAVLAPKRGRAKLIRLIVAFQLAYDYLDAINEAPTTASLRNGLQLHRALNDAVRSGAASNDYYLHHPGHGDGGYLAELVDSCRAGLRALPSSAAIEPVLLHATERCGAGQSHNHARLVEGEEQLIDWTRSLGCHEGYLWWELSAAGISCLAIHALFAAAAANSTRAQAEQIDAAYFPSVCALSALLDSLIDQSDDAAAANHNFAAHYSTPMATAERFAAIAAEARALSKPLRRRTRHAIILAGIASFYLSAPAASSVYARAAAARTLERLGPATTPSRAVMRWRRSTS
jgi:tetraprenyl-beta-curcumene synthase